ncbi:hypothetical protein EYB26_005507 [Talaromyces marneffei]|uniref:uncharacterized protein n=1 Tax=Talaromyces marneffei TaxID=37727 RepID=UPI0012A79A74|nr:uncharacterized protein EYB26_005507 [Talaromyces marneffei]QGA17831.1 hypothetical protein EYB26_005507 [Talaromyces marneffei]
MLDRVDVLVCGGGPTGLLTGLGLARQGISTVVIEKCKKSEQARFGRASLLYPRTLELLDQVDVWESMAEIAHISRGYVNYNGGKRVISGTYHSIFNQLHGTYFDYVVNIRQKYSEQIFRKAFEGYGGTFYEQYELLSIVQDNNAADDYALTVRVKNNVTGEEHQVKCKYLVGADGKNSAVRQLVEIPFTGDNTGIKWFRMDAVVKTDMPDARVGMASIESPVYGHVLWMCQDHGRTRIGFSLPPKLADRFGSEITEAEVRQAAKEAVAPFSLEFETVDWWTLYSVGQRVADTFRNKRVFLAGDACHSHSSGAGQGMNAGAQDALNLSWKLGGFLKGWYDESVLDTYEQERRPEAQRIIDQDKTLSALITGKIPEGVGRPGANSFEILGEFIASTMRYTLGLDVHYETNILNQKANIGLTSAGWPGRDVLLRRPGSRIPVRLQQVTKNVGRFHVLVFTGNPALTGDSLRSLRSYMDSEESFTRDLPDIFDYLTIIPGDSPQSDHYLGVARWGKAFYDCDQSAACTYGFSAALGGVVVLRPDGILGYSGELGEGKALGEYFRKFIKAIVASPQKPDAPIVAETEAKPTGEVEFDGEAAASKLVVNGVNGVHSETETPIVNGAHSEAEAPVVKGVHSETETPVANGGHSETETPVANGGHSETETPIVKGAHPDIQTPILNEVHSDIQTSIPIREAPAPIAA